MTYELYIFYPEKLTNAFHHKFSHCEYKVCRKLFGRIAIKKFNDFKKCIRQLKVKILNDVELYVICRYNILFIEFL